MKLDPTETVVGNVVRRVLKIIRDDYLRVHCGHSADTQTKLLLPHTNDDFATPYVDLQDHILESLDEFQQEIDFAVDSIVQHAPRLISDGEVVLTMGESSISCKVFSVSSASSSFGRDLYGFKAHVQKSS